MHPGITWKSKQFNRPLNHPSHPLCVYLSKVQKTLIYGRTTRISELTPNARSTKWSAESPRTRQRQSTSNTPAVGSRNNGICIIAIVVSCHWHRGTIIILMMAPFFSCCSTRTQFPGQMVDVCNHFIFNYNYNMQDGCMGSWEMEGEEHADREGMHAIVNSRRP